MATESLPEWNNRDEPAVTVTDIEPTAGRYMEYLHVVGTDTPDNAAQTFINQVNDDRDHLHKEIQHLYSPHLLRFYGGAVAEDVAHITQGPVYPSNRGVVHEELTEIGYTDDELNEETDMLRGIVRLPRRSLEVGDATDAFDAIASSIGAATLRGPVDLYFDDEAQPRVVAGSMWSYQGQTIGRLLCKAGTVKVAALVRRDYEVMRHADEAPSPLLRPYYHLSYAEPEAVMAVGIDQINRAAGVADDDYGFYEALWAFAQNGRDENAREAMEAYIHRATHGSGILQLEHLEAQSSAVGLPVGLLHRIEEACGIDPPERLSRIYE